MHKLFLIMHATKTIFIDYVHMALIKLRVKFKPLAFQNFRAKVGKVQKTH